MFISSLRNEGKMKIEKNCCIEKKEEKYFYLFIMPWLVGFLIFTAYPMAASFFYSFTDWDFFTDAHFIGLDNYKNLVKDDTFWKAIKNTFLYAAVFVPLNMGLSLFIACMLKKKMFGSSIFRTLFYVPTLIPAVVTSLLFFKIFAPNDGIVNRFLALFGIKGPEWFFSASWSKPSLIIMSLWGLGTGFILLLSGMQGIPEELYESVHLDGASKWKEFWYITFPMLSPVIFYNLIMGIIGSLQIFTQVYVVGTNALMPGGVSGSGGGPDNSLLSIVQLLYIRAFRDYHMGYASAIAWALFIIILILTMLVFKSSALWTYYEGEIK